MKKSPNKTIGIIGGAGPAAGFVLGQKIIDICQKEYGCVNDYDFPKIILLSVPFAEMLKPNTKEQKEAMVIKQLQEAIDWMVQNHVDYILVACNTLHAFLDQCTYPNNLLSLIDEEQNYITQKKFLHVLILCTKTSLQKHVFHVNVQQFADKDLQNYINNLIKKILSGSFSSKDAAHLEKILTSKIEKDPHIDGILLGCTELSVLQNSYPIKTPKAILIDPLDLIARKICKLTLINSGEK